jgi:hypothetical protein
MNKILFCIIVGIYIGLLINRFILNNNIIVINKK